MTFPKQKLGQFIICSLLCGSLSISSANAVDAETAQTIADLKAQVQLLIDRVKQLEAKSAAPPASTTTAPLLPLPPESPHPNKPCSP